MTKTPEHLFSKESEEALLGAILINPRILDQIDLSDDEFYFVRHQIIYNAMRVITFDELDILSITEYLKRQGKLKEVGGQAYLTSLMTECPNAYNWKVYRDIIRDHATRMRLLQTANHLARAAYDTTNSISDALSHIMTELAQAGRVSEGAKHISTYLKALYEQAEERAKDPKVIYGIPTGLTDFDKRVYGLQKGEQIILAGAPGTGKSLLAFQFACGMAEQGHVGAVYELEMAGLAVARRRVSAISQIPTYNIRSGVDMNGRWAAFVKAIEKMESLGIYVSESSSLTTAQLRADLSRLKQQYGVEWFIVDYLSKLSDKYGREDLDRLKYISTQLNSIAKDLNLAGITIQSVTKEGYSHPSMANVSGQIIVMVAEDNNIVELRWTKMREGGIPSPLKLYKMPGLPLFHSSTKQESPPGWWVDK